MCWEVNDGNARRLLRVSERTSGPVWLVRAFAILAFLTVAVSSILLAQSKRLDPVAIESEWQKARSKYDGAPALPSQQSHSSRHQHSGNPPAPVDTFVQKDFRRDGVADEGKGSCGGSHQAYIAPGERE